MRNFIPCSGLGLAIVRRIADMHDGTVEAIPLQQGMKFRISVPEIAVDPPLIVSEGERNRVRPASVRL
jgi:K+-sensing histidine kinase KdpD